MPHLIPSRKDPPTAQRARPWWARCAVEMLAIFLFSAVAQMPAVARSDERCGDESWVTVGHPGNASDVTGFGAVDDEFQIMKFEVTVAEYTDFLNAVASRDDPHQLWQRAMGEHVITDLGQGGIRKDVPQCILREGSSGKWIYSAVPDWENRPVIFVSCYSAMRYANWIHNGRGDGNTEDGVYRMSDGLHAKRSPDASVWLPSENEWYKAAYHQPESEGGPPGDYWRYPMSTMERPTETTPGSLFPNAAAFSRKFSGIVPVGSYPGARSPCGAMDMGGNVWEWTEDLIYDTKRVIRGGAAAHTWQKLQSTVRSNASPDRWYPDTGFRLARKVSP